MNFLPKTYNLAGFFFLLFVFGNLSYASVMHENHGMEEQFIKRIIPGKVTSEETFIFPYHGNTDELFLISGKYFGLVFPIKARFRTPVYNTHLAYSLYLLLIVLLFVTIFRAWSYRFARERSRLEKIINERTEELVGEKDKTENLLANLLPRDTANELKSTGKATKKKFNLVTVLFSDIQGFTKIAEQMNPEALIDALDKFFFHFDSVVEKYGIEKIKTIGDAYMCAGGIPEKNSTNPVDVVLAALEMQQYMKELQEKSVALKQRIWDIRIGIHTGGVIAGVVGHKKLSYDIWGDTVNTASRMESSGEPGKINISGPTYDFVKDFFICEYRGKMPVKYKGEIDMYFVEGIRPELSQDIKGMPNEKFYVRLQLVRLNDLEEHLLENLRARLPGNLYFHNLRHTIHVYTQVELLGRAYGLAMEEMLVLRTAALFHDAGMTENYSRHEEVACEMAHDLLQGFRYTTEQIEQICRLIMCTKPGSKPSGLQEQIMCDADLDYIGRADFTLLMLELYREELAYGKAGSFTEWRAKQISFLESFDFYTDIARKLREVPKEKQLVNLNNLTFPG